MNTGIGPVCSYKDIPVDLPWRIARPEILIKAIDDTADGIPPVHIWLGTRINTQVNPGMARMIDSSMSLLPLRISQAEDWLVAFDEDRHFLKRQKGIRGFSMPFLFFLRASKKSDMNKGLATQFSLNKPAFELINDIHKSGRRAVLIPSRPVKEVEDLCDKTGAVLFGSGSKLTAYLADRFVAYKLMRDAGLKLPDGRECNTAEEIAKTCSQLWEETPDDDLFLKTAFGSGGAGIIRLQRGQDLQPVLSAYGTQKRIRIERVMPKKGSVNLQLLIKKGCPPVPLLATVQKLTLTSKGGLRFYGNIYPPSALVPEKCLRLMETQAFDAALLLQEYGYSGIIGFDCIWDGEGDVIFTDLNPRWNASSYLLADFYATPKNRFCSTAFLDTRQGTCASIKQGMERFEGFRVKVTASGQAVELLSACLWSGNTGPVLSATILIQSGLPAQSESLEADCRHALEGIGG